MVLEAPALVAAVEVFAGVETTGVPVVVTVEPSVLSTTSPALLVVTSPPSSNRVTVVPVSASVLIVVTGAVLTTRPAASWRTALSLGMAASSGAL